MLFSTSLVALVLSPRHLIIQNTKVSCLHAPPRCRASRLTLSPAQRSSVICELTFRSAVLAVRLNRRRLAVVLDEEIYIYDIANMTLLHLISTSPNPAAICALAPASDKCYLAYPLPKPREDTNERRPQHAPPLSPYVPPTSGEVVIFDTITLKVVNVIAAHRSPLSCIALNNEGSLLATASETGTIIRVFTVPKGQKVYQFRRGTYPSTIYSMSFNLSSTLLCVSSTSDTVHIFRLSGAPGGEGDNAAGSTMPAGSTAPVEAATEQPSSPRGTRSSRARSRSYDSGNDSPNSATGSPRSDAADVLGLTNNTTSSGAGGRANRPQSGSFSNILRRSSQLMGRSVAGVVGSYLPQTVTEMWEPSRDFAFIKVPKVSSTPPPNKAAAGPGSSNVLFPNGPLRSVVAMSNSSPQVMVVTSDGGFYVYNIDMEHGGEGYLVRQFS